MNTDVTDVRTNWAWDPYQRDQPLRFRSLDDMIQEDDPVRLFDEVLGAVDWTTWEMKFKPSRCGQPPLHPRILASAWLYGVCRGIRSSRKLEEACSYRFDFLWLVKGHRPDHTTLAKFRTKFHEPLKDLFKQVGHLAMSIGLVRLGVVTFDATRVNANNSRYRTRTAATLAEKLQALDEQFEAALAALAQQDQDDAGTGSPTHLPDELAELKTRRAKVKAALEQAQAADEARRREGTNPQKNPAQVPTTDPASRVMPNKEGGYAPNYTPTALVDGERGFIVDDDVLNTVNEGPALVPSVDRVETEFGEIKQLLTDAGNNSGPIHAAMEEREIEFFAPAKSSQPQPGNPALRDDPRQPVPESERAQLPLNNQKKLDKSCFVFVPEADLYFCPQGEPLTYEETKRETQGDTTNETRVYRCEACATCPLKDLCLGATNKGGRTVSRDQYEAMRERTAARMATPRGRETYNQRPRIAETPFAILKAVMGLRKFLLRGLEKVRTEWRWATTAYNVMKLSRELGRLRAKFAGQS